MGVLRGRIEDNVVVEVVEVKVMEGKEEKVNGAALVGVEFRMVDVEKREIEL